MARKAKSLDALLAQVNAAYPDRDKSSDGWIGDAAHQATVSDHNPNGAGVVQAIDITHDPRHGLDSGKLAEKLLASRDPRIKYIISNRRIAASYKTGGVMPWTWRPYNGANAHDHHVHISVSDDPAKYDNEAPWQLTVPITSPAPSPASRVTTSQRRRMAKEIVKWEARRDREGHLAVYQLPANDGGGTYEVAGINDRYHPEMAAKLKSLIDARRYDEAEKIVEDYILAFTNVVQQWTTDAGVEFFLRDSAFNRGPKGAARILQRAAGVQDDGAVGPETKAALAKIKTPDLLTKLRAARESYERDIAGYRANFWAGLVNRWNAQIAKAREFSTEQPSTPVKTPTAVGVGTFALIWGWLHEHPALAVAGAVLATLIAVAIIEFWKRKG